MKKVITNFLLLMFCSIPRLIKGQAGIARFTVSTEEKSQKQKFIEASSTRIHTFPPSPFSETLLSLKSLQESENVTEAPDDIEKSSLCQVKFAMMLDVNIESVKNTLLYKFIESWFGTRYRFGGKTKKGIDCSAFTDSLLSAVYNLFIPRTVREQYKKCVRICKEELLEGDLVFFNTRGGVSHVGVYLANGRFVHSSSSRGVMISSLSEKYFSRRFVGAGRVQND